MHLKGQMMSAAEVVLDGVEIHCSVRVSDPSALRTSGREDEVASQSKPLGLCLFTVSASDSQLLFRGLTVHFLFLSPFSPLSLQLGSWEQPQQPGCLPPLSLWRVWQGMLGHSFCQSFLLTQKCAEEPRGQQTLSRLWGFTAWPIGRDGPCSLAVLQMTQGPL